MSFRQQLPKDINQCSDKKTDQKAFTKIRFKRPNDKSQNGKGGKKVDFCSVLFRYHNLLSEQRKIKLLILQYILASLQVKYTHAPTGYTANQQRFVQ